MQDLHADLRRDDPDNPMAAFIVMVDPFTEANGATRFVPGSHRWPTEPCEKTHVGEVMATGPEGSIIVFDAGIWHGHGGNRTNQPRRSLQGYFTAT